MGLLNWYEFNQWEIYNVAVDDWAECLYSQSLYLIAQPYRKYHVCVFVFFVCMQSNVFDFNENI